jgi:hypothetical protein
MQWRDNEFKVAINMAGAISAGAYTAGVLDFLTEALEEWQKAKDDYRKSRVIATGSCVTGRRSNQIVRRVTA